MRRTKIVATLGPAADDPEVLDGLLTAGVDVVRINYSHGPLESHTKRIEQLRERAQARDLQIGVIAQGRYTRRYLVSGRWTYRPQGRRGHTSPCGM